MLCTNTICVKTTVASCLIISPEDRVRNMELKKLKYVQIYTFTHIKLLGPNSVKNVLYSCQTPLFMFILFAPDTTHITLNVKGSLNYTDV